MRPGRWIGLGVLRARQLLRLAVRMYGPLACMLVWFMAIASAVFAYTDPPDIPYCATVDRMPRGAAVDLLLLVAGCVLAPLLAGVLFWLGWEQGRRWLAAGCLALVVGSGMVLGLLGIATGDRLAEAAHAVADPPQAVISPGAVPDLCRQIYPDWEDVVSPAP